MTFDQLKRQADAAFLSAIHPGTIPDPEWEVDLTGSPSFDGGCRQLPLPPRRIDWVRDPDDPAWFTTTI